MRLGDMATSLTVRNEPVPTVRTELVEVLPFSGTEEKGGLRQAQPERNLCNHKEELSTALNNASIARTDAASSNAGA